MPEKVTVEHLKEIAKLIRMTEEEYREFVQKFDETHPSVLKYRPSKNPPPSEGGPPKEDLTTISRPPAYKPRSAAPAKATPQAQPSQPAQPTERNFAAEVDAQNEATAALKAARDQQKRPGSAGKINRTSELARQASIEYERLFTENNAESAALEAAWAAWEKGGQNPAAQRELKNREARFWQNVARANRLAEKFGLAAQRFREGGGATP